MLRTGGAVAASGNTGGMALETTVAPFILRGVALLGIDTVTTPIARRRELWNRMTGDLAPRGLDDIRRVVALTDVEIALDEIALRRRAGPLRRRHHRLKIGSAARHRDPA